MTEKQFTQLPVSSFHMIRTMIREYCGLNYNENTYEIFSGRIESRMKQLGISNIADYLEILRNDHSDICELKALIEIFSNRETYFFREQNQLDVFKNVLLDDIIKKKKTVDRPRVKIWCAGCASGEEPYSIAILILEKRVSVQTEIDILGFDISDKALRNAKQGIYRKASFRYTHPAIMNKYFTQTTDGVFEINVEIKKMVRFIKKNMILDDQPDLMGTADIIFCRNVMIYFDPEGRKKLINWLVKHLAPGGFVLLGHSESLLNMDTPLQAVTINTEIVYQKSEFT
ncbi:MAG: hypothetical protein A2161_16785 [Candidatus Schekmanbacteria bacterium RBG_13_48_7]|uniref:protein-glutamate O-methyltransferase n=1 Tax=Candidatus Schekmanbacteria bacterium RBG_13_48_7 TaxID=1817878 RepID=A0A1F7RJW9_9BACT|nr:MAG: hypothetical protein A2161_16785 [Candidatus Schekmanbacteria bacterium RBG_13_48_7]